MATGGIGISRLVGGIFTLVGLVLLGVAGWAGNRQYTILKSWPTVEAVVTKSQVTHSQSHDIDRSTDTTMYEAAIEFRYTLNGKEYATPATSGYSSSSYTEMKRQADAYPPGTRHRVRYNPADPNDIRYNAGYTFGFFFLPVLLGGMGIVFGGLGVLFLYLSRSERVLLCPSCSQPVERNQRFCPNCVAPLSAGD